MPKTTQDLIARLQGCSNAAVFNGQPTPLDSRARYRLRDLAEFADAVLKEPNP